MRFLFVYLFICFELEISKFSVKYLGDILLHSFLISLYFVDIFLVLLQCADTWSPAFLFLVFGAEFSELLANIVCKYMLMGNVPSFLLQAVVKFEGNCWYTIMFYARWDLSILLLNAMSKT